MSENRIQKQADQKMADGQVTEGAPQPARRRLLKSTVAIPVIMTLYSGAALARTSNLVGAVRSYTEAATVTDDLHGERIVCVAPGAGPIEEGGSTYDLGENPTGFLGKSGPMSDEEKITYSPETEWTLENQAKYCEYEGGILISAAAFTSLAAKGGVLSEYY